MTLKRKRAFTLLILMILGSSVQAQYFSDIQKYSTPLLLNPSFAGSTRGDRLYASLQSTHREDTKAYLQFISHDFYYKKRALGLGYVTGFIMDSKANMVSPFLSLAISKYIPRENKKYFIPSLSIGFVQPLKNYSQFYFDRVVVSPGQVLPPGETLVRTTVVTGRVGFLLTDYNGSAGLSVKGMRSYAKTTVYQNPDSLHYEVNNYHILFHAEKIFTYYRRGLLSQKYLIRPRVIIQMGNDYNQLFGEMTVQHNRFQAGVGYLPRLDSGNARFSLALGYDFKYFKLHYLGSVLDEQGTIHKPMHNITVSVIFPRLRRFGIPIPGMIRSL